MTDRDALFRNAPLDDRLTAVSAAQGLEARRLAPDDRPELDAWYEAVRRGFLGTEPSETQRDAFFARGDLARRLGVYDPENPQPSTPVATFASWGAQLTVPGGTVPSCAISSVTVAPTHRRRGLLRSLMSGELRTAAAAGYPFASLTVSEAGIYGRFGFGPAALVSQWTIAVRQAGWRGPTPDGRIDFVSREEGRARAAELHERVRVSLPGEVDARTSHWDDVFGTRAGAEKAAEHRVLQYRSPQGSVDGLAVYRVTENHDDFAASALDVELLLVASDDAYAALWRFLLSMDLIATVRAELLSVDEPLWWMIADQRAATIVLREHHYLRVLDVPAAVQARRYGATDELVLEVEDPLDIAAGRFLLSTRADGTAEVMPVTGEQPGALVVRLGVAELSSIMLGGVSPVTLARAGRLETVDSARLARVFAWPEVPRLSFWY